MGCDDKVYTGTKHRKCKFWHDCCGREMQFFCCGQGKNVLNKLALVTEADTLVTPCGACLQVLKEFADDLEVTIN